MPSTLIPAFTDVKGKRHKKKLDIGIPTSYNRNMEQTKRELPELMSQEQVAEYLGVALQTLANWRTMNKGPRYTKIGGAVQYRKVELIEWLESQTRPQSGGL